jgi:hypothetical protein
MAIAGKDFVISIDVDGEPTPICYATDCIIDIQYEAREVIDPASNWKNYIGDMAGYTLSVPGLIAYSDVVNWVQLEQWAGQRKKLSWYASAFGDGGVTHSGTMLITGLNLTSQQNDAMKFDMNAVGCGPLVQQLLPIIKDVYLSDLGGVRLPGCPNPYPCVVLWYDGTVIGLANNADDVMTVFNNYEGNQYYQLVGTDTGCNFTMSIAWNAPEQPDWVPAEQGAGFVLGRTGHVGDNDVIGETGQIGDNNVIGPFQTA